VAGLATQGGQFCTLYGPPGRPGGVRAGGWQKLRRNDKTFRSVLTPPLSASKFKMAANDKPWDMAKIPTPNRQRLGPHFGIVQSQLTQGAESGTVGRALFPSASPADGSAAIAADGSTATGGAGPADLSQEVKVGILEIIPARDGSKREDGSSRQFAVQSKLSGDRETVFTVVDGFNVNSVIDPTALSTKERKWAAGAFSYLASFVKTKLLQPRWLSLTSVHNFDHLSESGKPAKDGSEPKLYRIGAGPTWYLALKCENEGCGTVLAIGGFYERHPKTRRPLS
jgi:hypothetical protein